MTPETITIPKAEYEAMNRAIEALREAEDEFFAALEVDGAEPEYIGFHHGARYAIGELERERESARGGHARAGGGK